MVSGLRGLRRGPSPDPAPAAAPSPPAEGPEVERCDLCGVEIPPKHEHLLHLGDRRIICACATKEFCQAFRLGCGNNRILITRADPNAHR